MEYYKKLPKILLIFILMYLIFLHCGERKTLDPINSIVVGTINNDSIMAADFGELIYYTDLDLYFGGIEVLKERGLQFDFYKYEEVLAFYLERVALYNQLKKDNFDISKQLKSDELNKYLKLVELNTMRKYVEPKIMISSELSEIPNSANKDIIFDRRERWNKYIESLYNNYKDAIGKVINPVALDNNLNSNNKYVVIKELNVDYSVSELLKMQLGADAEINKNSLSDEDKKEIEQFVKENILDDYLVYLDGKGKGYLEDVNFKEGYKIAEKLFITNYYSNFKLTQFKNKVITDENRLRKFYSEHPEKYTSPNSPVPISYEEIRYKVANDLAENDFLTWKKKLQEEQHTIKFEEGLKEIKKNFPLSMKYFKREL